jgi:hypothetical protein
MYLANFTELTKQVWTPNRLAAGNSLSRTLAAWRNLAALRLNDSFFAEGEGTESCTSLQYWIDLIAEVVCFLLQRASRTQAQSDPLHQLILHSVVGIEA